MNSTRFDDLTRNLFSLSTRRSAIRVVLSGALGSLAAGLGLEETAACGNPGTACKRDTQCCSGRCNRKRGRCAGCPSGQKLCRGACIPREECCGGCPQGQTCCQFATGGLCFDVRNDRAHCGRCGTNGNSACPAGAICANGDCGLTCTTVGEKCFDVCNCGRRVDPSHTGQKVCATVRPSTCALAKTCGKDADCDPGTGGFRKVCVGGLCAGKNVCADPCA